MHRIGIIPFETKADAVALLFVTSHTRGRWILPKGLAKPNESHADTCHREGFEEAGVRGIVLDDFPSTIVIGKQTKKGVKQIPVTYYPYLVQEQVDEWPEQSTRQRHWALIEDAQRVAYREDFSGLLKQFDALRPWIKKFAEKQKS